MEPVKETPDEKDVTEEKKSTVVELDPLVEGDDTEEDQDDGVNDDDDDDEWDGYEPSISDRLQIGYYRMDRACQTNESDLVNLKQLSDILSIVTMDITSLKKNLYYAKLTLQAEYDGRLQDELTALNIHINARLAEIETMHHERINVLRRSYRTRLSNALCKLSKDYHRYYGKKDADAKASHIEKINELEHQRLESRKQEFINIEMAEMLRLQAEDANTDVENNTSSMNSIVTATKYTMEIDELNNCISKLDSKIEYLEDMLDETNEDNSKLNSEVNELTTKLNDEEQRTKDLQEEISVLNKKIIKERFAAQERLNQQKDKLKGEMDAKVRSTRQKMQEESARHVEEMKKNETEKLQQQKMLEEIKIKELMSKQEEIVPVQQVVDHDTVALQQIQESQQDEILRLRKELQRKTKLWEMKVKILQEHIHVLKDEMFLRSTLQRQSAKMKQAGLTYAKQGSQDVPLGVSPVDEKNIQRRHRLPTLIQTPKTVNQESSDEVIVNPKIEVNYCRCK